jgi:ketosteroid isomerase-like protein
MTEDMEAAERKLRGAYDAFNRGDFDSVVEALHPEIEWQRVAEVEGVDHGRDAVREFLKPDIFERQEAHIVRITTHGEKLLVHANFVGAFSATGIELEQEGWQLWTVRDGLAARLEAFLDRDQALEAAGPES